MGSHASLDRLFKRAGAPGDPPNLAHHSKWKEWLLLANQDPNVDPLQILGGVIEEIMEGPPPNDDVLSEWLDKKQSVEVALKKYELVYRSGGVVQVSTSGLPGKALEIALRAHDFATLEVEFERASSNVETDPGSALTAACSLLEALFRVYLEAHNIALPSKISIKPLWTVVQNQLGLHPKSQEDKDVQRILSGMSSVVDGIGALRTHSGSAHGGGALRYAVQPRHARLAVNAAHTLATFVIETWEARDAV